MPVYNVAAYLPQAIDSILRQNWSDFELIAVDDGSTDHTLAILRQYARRDPRVRVISRPNTGIAGALNDGLAAARGRYLARMDGDDICAPDRLALQLAFLEAHPSCAAVGTAMQTIDPAGLPIAIVNPPLDHTHIDAQHLRGDGGAIAHPTAMFRTAALRSVSGYRPQYNFVEDLDLFLRLAERGQLANLPQILYSYRTHLLSQTHLVGTCFTKRDRQTVLIEQLLLETYKRRGLPGSPDLVQLRLSRSEPQQDAVTTVRWWALHALQLGNLPAARRHAWMLLRRRPASLDAWRIAYWSLAG